jgi:glycosyltransferase involved in cell wall biosynthesis
VKRISVTIPVYNEINYIQKTLESVIGDADEIIIGDNASTDGTSDICQSFAERYPEIKYTRHKENLGAIENSRFCNSQITGKYIRKMGAHDMISIGSNNSMADILDNNSDAVMVYPKYVIALNYDYSFKYFYIFNEYENNLISNSSYYRSKSIIHNFKKNTSIYFSLYKNDILKKLLTTRIFQSLSTDHLVVSTSSVNGKLLSDDKSIFFRMYPRDDVKYEEMIERYKKTFFLSSNIKIENNFFWNFLIIAEQMDLFLENFGNDSNEYNELSEILISNYYDWFGDKLFTLEGMPPIVPGKEEFCQNLMSLFKERYKKEHQTNINENNNLIETAKSNKENLNDINKKNKIIKLKCKLFLKNLPIIKQILYRYNNIRNYVHENNLILKNIQTELNNINSTQPYVINTLQNIDNKNNVIINSIIKNIPKATLRSIRISLVEHCNLNCWGCNHFAPLADENYLDVNEFEIDMKRLSEITIDKNIGSIGLMGGEPLLHKEINKIIMITRKYFPFTRLEIVTNGLLLLKMNDEFWQNCRKNNIVIVATKYPISLNYNKIKDKAEKELVLFEFYGNTENEIKTSIHFPLDVSGLQNSNKEYLLCDLSNECIELYHGHLYTCTIIPHVKYFNKTFNYNLNVCEADSINIHKAESLEEIMQFLTKPVPFCRYCKTSARKGGFPWKQSKKEINEWI